MFHNISWAAYIAAVAILLIGYYLFIGVKFYSRELRQLIFGTKLSDRSTSAKIEEQENKEPDFQVQEIQPELFTSHQKYTPPIEEIDDTFQQVERLTAELKEAIARAVEKNSIKEELVLSLQLIIKQNCFFKGSPFLVAINNLIASECEKYGYIQLSAEERVMLWNE